MVNGVLKKTWVNIDGRPNTPTNIIGKVDVRTTLMRGKTEEIRKVTLTKSPKYGSITRNMFGIEERDMFGIKEREQEQNVTWIRSIDLQRLPKLPYQPHEVDIATVVTSIDELEKFLKDANKKDMNRFFECIADTVGLSKSSLSEKQYVFNDNKTEFYVRFIKEFLPNMDSNFAHKELESTIGTYMDKWLFRSMYEVDEDDDDDYDMADIFENSEDEEETVVHMDDNEYNGDIQKF